jgi:hypothetical protein
MTRYTGMCGSNGHGLTIRISFMGSMCVCVGGGGGFGFNGFVTNDVAIPNGWSL